MVGKSDFNENPVVSPDLDLDFGLRLRVCQLTFALFASFTFQPFFGIGGRLLGIFVDYDEILELVLGLLKYTNKFYLLFSLNADF